MVFLSFITISTMIKRRTISSFIIPNTIFVETYYHSLIPHLPVLILDSSFFSVSFPLSNSIEQNNEWANRTEQMEDDMKNISINDCSATTISRPVVANIIIQVNRSKQKKKIRIPAKK